jgi:hypothetical protein
MAVRSSDYPPKPLPGQAAVNIVLALAVWCAGVYFTQLTIPFGRDTFAPWLAAFGLQLLLSLAQSNLRVGGISLAGWPFVVFTILDVLINAAGFLFLTGLVDGPADVVRYAVRALLTGVGLWQCGLALLGGALIATAPEQMVREALKQR